MSHKTKETTDKNRTGKFILSALLSILPYMLPAQSEQATGDYTPAAQFFATERNMLREKLYLHLDKPYYAAGDTIWLRGTLVNADTHSYLVKSNFIYVELINANDSVVSRRKLKRDGLCFHNNLPLSNEIPEGDYSIRAYTNYMRNFDEDFFYSKRLHIGNTLKPQKAPAAVKHDFHLTVMPEGGPLLAGVSQRIAFKAQANNGLGEDIYGAVFTEQGDTIARFNTLHDGMGATLVAVPQAGKLKVAATSKKDGLRKVFPFPEAVTEGISLQANLTTDGNLSYQILTSAGHTLPPGLRLLAHTRSLLMAEVPLKDGETNGTLPTGNFPDGILHLLVTTADGKALTRRLIFINNRHERNRWLFSTDKPTYGKRERVRLDFMLQDISGRPLRGDFSLSITDAKTITPDTLSDNIISNLLLTSDLKGYIKNPAWYWNGVTPQEKALRAQALDLVMLTHGWSRFNTDNVHTLPDYPLTEALEVGQYISGKVTGISSKESGNMVSAINPEEKEFASTTILEDGTFYIDGLDIPEGRYFGLKLLTRKKMGVKFTIDEPTFPTPNHKEPFVTDLLMFRQEKEKNYLSDGMKMYMLPDVQVTSKKSSHPLLRNFFVKERINNLQVRDLIDPNRVTTALDLFDVIATEVYPGHFFSPEFLTYAEAGEGNDLERGWKPIWGPLTRLYINGDEYNSNQATGNASIETALTRIRAVHVDRIEFVQRTEADHSHEMTMIVYTKPGTGYTNEAPDPRVKNFFPFGYSAEAYFYHPIYETPAQKSRTVDDARTTLYWNPSIQTDAEGRGAAIFYTSDQPGHYHAVIEGVTFDGRPCRLQFTIDN
ncbi:MAG: hypothetical protein IJ467_04895 [Bacteroidaceae bacterium]|nr:hypothetical protein [Bacteroidaceae bacterium]